MSVLIIGTIPPPLGGVTIHTARLIDLCNKGKINYSFYNLQKFNIISFFKSLSKSKKAHLHSSNALLLFLHVFLCRVLKTNSIITIHGDIEGHNIFLSFVEKCAIKLCNIPIVLNQNSFNKAIKINPIPNNKKTVAFEEIEIFFKDKVGILLTSKNAINTVK